MVTSMRLPHGSRIRTFGMHDTFALNRNLGHRESLTVVENNGRSLAIDCPGYIYPALPNSRIASSCPTKLDYLLITHIDADHIGGLDTLLWAKAFGEKKPLNLITLPSIKDQLWERLKSAFGHDRVGVTRTKKQFGDYINFFPVQWGQSTAIPNFGTIEAFTRSTNHSPKFDTLAFRIFNEAGEPIASFSSDTPFDPELVLWLAKPGGLIFHEAGSYQPGSKAHTYFTDLIGLLPRETQERLVINHIPEMLESQIRTAIVDSDSPIRLADRFYPEDLSQPVGSRAMQGAFRPDAVYPGTFDPFTNGHLAVVVQYLERYPQARLAIITGINPSKKPAFSPEERIALIEKSIPSHLRGRVIVRSDPGVIADYLYEQRIPAFLKGVRDDADFVYESTLAALNSQLSGSPMTMLIPQTDPKLTQVSSSNLKMLIGLGLPMSNYANAFVREALRMKKMGQLLVGVTGGIGSGKSSLCKGLVQLADPAKMPINSIDMDRIGHTVLESKDDKPLYFNVRQGIVDRFGLDVLRADDTIDRKRLGEIVFKDPKLAKELSELMMESILYLFSHELRKVGKGVVLVEGAILVEHNLTELVDDNLIVVGLDSKVQAERLKSRNLTDEQIRTRMNSQLSREQRLGQIRAIQAASYDRLLIEADSTLGKDELAAAVHEQLVAEYERRGFVVR